jgi:hypothetical protein
MQRAANCRIVALFAAATDSYLADSTTKLEGSGRLPQRQCLNNVARATGPA